jgi:sugar phosphate isomerase/epimerase
MITAANLAVCSWSLRPTDPHDLIRQLQTIGIQRVQIALDPLRSQPAVWGALPELCAKNGITFASAMIATVGEDYSTMESIAQTGGVVPDTTWEENWRNLQADAEIARALGVKLVTFHAGFLPHDPSDRTFQKLLQRITLIAELFAAKGMELGFETGQERAETLRTFLRLLNQPNVGVNYDPANIILYDMEDPIAALRALGPWLKQCHIKDAVKAKKPGTWGQEVVVGTGQVDWAAFFRTVEQLRFSGNFCIEREAGEQRVADICAAHEYLARFTQ